MTMQGDTIRVTLLVTHVLEKLGIRYAVGGSLSSSLHGVMRSTMDVDIIADLHAEHIQPLLAALSAEFYADEEMIRDALQRHSSFNLIHYDTAFKADIFIPKARPFDAMHLERRISAVITNEPDEILYFTSPEDIILSKLEWYRMGGEVSDRQWRDIIGILKVKTGNLDMDYLHHWANELNIGDLLGGALAQSGA